MPGSLDRPTETASCWESGDAVRAGGQQAALSSLAHTAIIRPCGSLHRLQARCRGAALLTIMHELPSRLSRISRRCRPSQPAECTAALPLVSAHVCYLLCVVAASALSPALTPCDPHAGIAPAG